MVEACLNELLFDGTEHVTGLASFEVEACRNGLLFDGAEHVVKIQFCLRLFPLERELSFLGVLGPGTMSI